MDFTRINISKYNYCFADHPFPEETTEFPHHTQMFNYIKSYVEKHKLFDDIMFKTSVVLVEGSKGLNSFI